MLESAMKCALCRKMAALAGFCVIVVLYWHLTVVMPRAGGDYVFISRAFSGALGFVASFLLFIAVLISAGSGSYWAFAEAGTQLSFGGQVIGDSTLANLGNLITPWTTTSPWLLFGVGVIILGAGGLAVMLGGRFFRILVYSFFAYGLFTMIIVLGVFLAHSHTDFTTAYGRMFDGGVAKVFADAASKGYSPGVSLAQLGAIVPLLFVSIGPYPVMQTVGGEIRNPKRSLLFGIVLAELVSIFVWLGLTYVLDSVVGISFIEAWTLTVGGGAATVPTAFATILDPNRVLLWIIVVGLFIGNIGWSWLSVVFVSRLFMAWSFDRILPSALAHVDDRLHTPTTAILLATMLAAIPMYLEYFTSFITAQVNAIFLYAVVWFLAGVSAAILPFRRKAIFEASPAKTMIGPIPVLSLFGILGAALFGYMGYNALTNPAIGPFALDAQLFIIGIMLLPTIIYAVSYYYNRKRGIDLRLLCTQLPPD
jgi:amino acid transporter